MPISLVFLFSTRRPPLDGTAKAPSECFRRKTMPDGRTAADVKHIGNGIPRDNAGRRKTNASPRQGTRHAGTMIG